MCRGFAGAAALLSFYGAPLATLIKIIKSRDASSLDPRLAIMMFINMVMWLSYGLVSPALWIHHRVFPIVVEIGQVKAGNCKATVPLRADACKPHCAL